MKVSILPALVLLDAVLAGLIVLMSAFPEPEPPRIIDTVAPAPTAVIPVAMQSVVDQPTSAETTMFGASGVPNKEPVDVPPAPPSQSGVGDISLLGVLIAQHEGNRQAVVSLLRHGNPPVVSRLALGGTLDGWTLTSATRTTVTLSGRDGTTRVLQVGIGTRDKAPR